MSSARVAVAGSGSFARYLAEELTKVGFQVTILARSAKPYFENMPNVTTKIVDFESVDSIAEALGDDTEALISAILDYTMALNVAQLNMIKAAQRSPKTKRFIPSEFGGNVEDYPDQTPFYLENRGPSRKVLREQTELEWTLFSTSWFVDWVVPEKNRYLAEVGDVFPVNLKDKKMVIPGAGIEPLDMISARDAAKAIAHLLKAPYGTWEPYIYVSGGKSDWRKVRKEVEQAYPYINFDVSYFSLTQMIDAFTKAKDDMERITLQYQIFAISNAGNFDPDKVAAHREKYFKGVHFRTVQEILNDHGKNPEAIV